MVKNGTPGFAGDGAASSVLPMPGGPTSSTPRGIRRPAAGTCWGPSGIRRSLRGPCLASSTPATFERHLAPCLGQQLGALDLPKPMAPPRPPPCIWRMKKNHTPMMTRNGSQLESRIDQNGDDPALWP